MVRVSSIKWWAPGHCPYAYSLSPPLLKRGPPNQSVPRGPKRVNPPLDPKSHGNLIVICRQKLNNTLMSQFSVVFWAGCRLEVRMVSTTKLCGITELFGVFLETNIKNLMRLKCPAHHLPSPPQKKEVSSSVFNFCYLPCTNTTPWFSNVNCIANLLAGFHPSQILENQRQCARNCGIYLPFYLADI